MKADDIVLLALKHTILAFRKDTGERIWSTKIASGLTEGFVSLISDETRVYGHAGGELHCLDLFTGQELWSDGLSGYGYGIATLALPGGGASNIAAISRLRQETEANKASHSATTG